MTTGTSEDSNKVFVASAMEAAIKIGVLVLIVIWCFQIVRPFITLVVWGIIIAVALYPINCALSARLGGKDKLAAVLLTVSI